MAVQGVAVRVLGPLTVLRGGEVVSVGGPRPRALLLRLVVADELVSTDRLVEDLWAGDPPRSAVNTLQTYVSMLRRALGDEDQSIIVRDGPGYRLGADTVDVDAVQFEQLVASARAAAGPAERLRSLDEALARWRGPALVDVADTEWARPIALGFEEARVAATEDRFDALLELGAHVQAAGELPAVVAEHPLRERLAGQLVLALYRSGRQAEALRAFDRTRELLVEELGLEPGPELAALQRAVLDQDPALDAPVPTETRPEVVDRTASDEPSDGPVLPGAAGRSIADGPVALPAAAARAERRPMVGRADQLAELRATWDRTEQPSLLLLTGEPGIGKTRLAAALAGAVHDDGATVLWGACPREPLGPYQPVAGALREHLRSLPGRAAERVLDDLAPLAGLLPDLVAGPAPSSDPTADRYQLFDAVTTAFSILAERRGVVLVLDDLHWADPDTCSLLAHLLRHAPDATLLVVATVRSHDVEPNPALIELLADLQRDRLVARRPLDGLSVEGIRALAGTGGATGPTGDTANAGGVDGPTMTDAEAMELERATGGNPYFVEEILAARREAGRRSGDHPVEVPDSIRDVLRARFQRLGDEVRSVLELAALVGAELDLAIVDRAGDVHGDDLLDRVDRAVAAGLLVESPRVLGRYTFAHELVRQTLADGHGATRRARLHLRIADALEANDAAGGVIDTADVPASVAHHRLAALPLGEVEAALDAVLAATRHAFHRLAFGDACASVDQALASFARSGAAIPPARHAELLLELGRARRSAGDLAAAGDAYTDAVGHARAAGRTDLEADAVLGVVGPRPTGTRLDFEPADPALLALVDQALAGVGDDPARRAALIAARVWLLPRSATTEERLGSLDEALEIARRIGDLALEARVLLARHVVLIAPDRLDERFEPVLTAVDRAVDADAPDLEVLARVAATSDLLERGDLDAVHEQVRRMGEIADRLGQPAYRFYPGTFGVLLALFTGDHVAAETQAFAMFEATKSLRTDVAGEVALVSRLYQVARDRGTMADLYPMLAQQLDGSSQPFLNAAYALGAAEVGEVPTAIEQLALLVGDDPAVELVPREALWMGTLAFAIETAAILADGRSGAALGARLVPFAGRLVVVGTIYCLGSVDRYVGLGHLAAGELDDADRWTAGAIEIDRRTGARPFLLRGLAERALILQRRGEPGDGAAAESLAAEATTLADQLGVGHPWPLRAYRDSA